MADPSDSETRKTLSDLKKSGEKGENGMSISKNQRCLISDRKEIDIKRRNSDGREQSINHRLTGTRSVLLAFVPTWFVPLPMCDHSQGVYFPLNTGGRV